MPVTSSSTFALATPATSSQKPGLETSGPFSFGGFSGVTPSYSQLLQDLGKGRVQSLELAPRQRLVSVVFKDGQRVQVPVFSDNQLLLRTAEQARVPLTVRDERPAISVLRGECLSIQVSRGKDLKI